MRIDRNILIELVVRDESESYRKKKPRLFSVLGSQENDIIGSQKITSCRGEREHQVTGQNDDVTSFNESGALMGTCTVSM